MRKIPGCLIIAATCKGMGEQGQVAQQEPRTTQERALELLRATLGSDRWLPTTNTKFEHLVWAIRGAIVLGLVVLITSAVDKSLWDWLKLLVVPAVLAVGGYLFTRSENQRRDKIAEDQRALDRELADQRRQDDTLQAYLDGMSQLLTDKDRPLHRSQRGDSLSTEARARTLTVLPRLARDRKARVVQFLYDSNLIAKDRVVLALVEADLIEAQLRGAQLREANLGGALLSRANLSAARLFKADLSYANLNKGNLRNADLQGADLQGADLQEANLQKAHLDGFMKRVKLEGGILEGAILSGANLSGADLSFAQWAANLSGADLSGADLSKANLSNTNLSEAKGWTKEQLLAADWLVGATMPDGQILQGATVPDGPTFEDWLKSRSRGEEGENSVPS